MFESCRGCDTADLFHFDAYNEGPPWGPRMSFSKDPNAIVLGTHAAALLFLGGSTVLVLHARGERDIPSTLGFREGMEGPSTPLSADASKREFGGTSTNVLSANHTCQVSLIWLLAQPAGDSTSVRCGRVLKVLGVKRVTGRQNSGAPKCKYVIGLHTYPADAPTGWRTPLRSPRTG